MLPKQTFLMESSPFKHLGLSCSGFGLKDAQGSDILFCLVLNLILMVTRQSQTLHVLSDAALNENVA